jgi:hypothetical protein
LAKTILDGYNLTASPADGIHTNAGILRGFLVCNNSAAAIATLTLYDNTTATGTVLATIHLGAGQNPFYVMFPRDHAPRFTTGLSATFANATVLIWSVDFG